MYPKNELIRLFDEVGCKKPSVVLFKKLLSPMPAEQQAYYKAYAFRLGMHEWKNLNKRYQTFLIHLIRKDLQAFANFLLKDTLLGAVRYHPEDPAVLLKSMNLQERNGKEVKTACARLAFALLLGFAYPYTVNTLRNKIGVAIPTAEELRKWVGKVPITNKSV